MKIELDVQTPQQAELVTTLMQFWFNPKEYEKRVEELGKALKPVPEPTTSVVPPVARVKAEKPTPLEVAIEEKKAAHELQPEEPATDPFRALMDETPTAAELGNPVQTREPEKKPRGRPKKDTAPKEEPKPEDKPLAIEDVRAASKIALELIGAPVIQEALAKFNAVEEKTQALKMRALREADYELYIGYLKKKVNDAAKEWPQ